MSWKGGPRSQIATCKTFPSAPPVFTITLKHTPNLVWSQTLCFILDKGLGTNGLNLCNRCKLRFSNLNPVWGLYFDLIGQFLERGCNWEKRKIDPHWAMPQPYLVYLFQNVLVYILPKSLIVFHIRISKILIYFHVFIQVCQCVGGCMYRVQMLLQF